MDKARLRKVLETTQIDLLQFPIFCSFMPSIDNVERVLIRDFIYFDGLTKDRFFGSLHQLIRLYALISSRIGVLLPKKKS